MILKEIKIAALIPTRAGCAVFLGAEDKVIHFFIDLHIGQSINTALAGETLARPLTHDLFSATLSGFGGRMTKMIINDCKNEIFFARVYWEMENETHERSVVEIDSRPSDALALAVRQKAPILIKAEVWDECEDMTSLLNDLQTQMDDAEGML